LHLGVAGDAFAGPALRETGVERAWRSGTALAEQLLSSNG
jgi:predicted NAD/FAD-dependent oxidoreductase